MPEVVRVRIAPSPTGKFHIGTARTALFNYLFARRHGGKFLVRIEDTDKERSEDIYTQDILAGLRWLGLEWDEGPEVGGPFEPYFQQERLHIYQSYLDTLLDEGKAYKCFCSAEELEKERAEQQARKEPPKYSGKCAQLSEAEIRELEAAHRPYAIRFKVAPEVVVVEDLIRGQVQFDANLIGDFPLTRRDGTPLFVLTNVVDDAVMEISHVLRGEEHLSNTAKQILLCEAINIMPPQFGHFPLIMNTDRTKMSKRKNPVSITDDYQAKGYLSEAIVNYIALLGWSSGTDREIFSLHDLTKEFDLNRVGKSASIFDADKLLWMNGHYLRQLSLGELAHRLEPFIKNEKILEGKRTNTEHFLQVIATIHERIKLLSEIDELIGFYYEAPKNYDINLLVAKKSSPQNAALALECATAALSNLEDFTVDALEPVLRATAAKINIKDGEMLWTVRFALCAQTASAGAFEILEVLGKDESIKRLTAALEALR